MMDNNVRIMNSLNSNSKQRVFCHHDIILKNDIATNNLLNFKEICLFCGKEISNKKKSIDSCMVNLGKYSEGLLNGITYKDMIINTFREIYLRVVYGDPKITYKEKKEILIEYIDKTNREIIRNNQQKISLKKTNPLIRTKRGEIFSFKAKRNIE